MSVIKSRIAKLEELVRGNQHAARRPGISDEALVKLRCVASKCSSGDELTSYLISQLPPNYFANASLDDRCRKEAAIAAAAVALFSESRPF